MRGFGTTFDLETGSVRVWYSGHDGVRRWADTTELVEDERRPYDNNDSEDET